ncbi:MAG: DegV family protein [Chloroflexota bacterium]
MIKVVTDSTAYLTPEFVRQHDIRVVPLNVLFGAKSFREGADLGYDEFYRMLAEADELPTTSQPAAGDFLKVYSELLDAGHEMISVHISSGISGTVDSALAARKMLSQPERVSVVDSLSTSMGLELIVRAALEGIQGGQSRDEIVVSLEQLRQRVQVYFVVDTLEYLHKGGRIGGASALLGTVLQFKPILFLQAGKIEPWGKVRTKRKAVAKLVDIIEEKMGGQPVGGIGVVHALVADEAEELMGQLRQRQSFDTCHVSQIGPVIGTHTGPGVLGVAAFAAA